MQVGLLGQAKARASGPTSIAFYLGETARLLTLNGATQCKKETRMTPDYFASLAAFIKNMELQMKPHREIIAKLANQLELLNKQQMGKFQFAVKQMQTVMPGLQNQMAVMAKHRAPRMSDILRVRQQADAARMEKTEMGKIHTNPHHNHSQPAFGRQTRLVSLMASDPDFQELADTLQKEYQDGTQPKVVTQAEYEALEQENEALRSEAKLLRWVLLGLGVDYPPDAWNSFDDFTGLSKN